MFFLLKITHSESLKWKKTFSDPSTQPTRISWNDCMMTLIFVIFCDSSQPPLLKVTDALSDRRTDRLSSSDAKIHLISLVNLRHLLRMNMISYRQTDRPRFRDATRQLKTFHVVLDDYHQISPPPPLPSRTVALFRFCFLVSISHY